MPCYNCGRPGMFIVGPPGEEVHLCLDCNIKFTQLNSMRAAESERVINYLQDQMESLIGIPMDSPRFPERRIIQGGNVTLNNINISNSTVGVLNTGAVQNIDSAVTLIRQSGGSDLSSSLAKLTEAIISTPDMSDEAKNKALELLGFVAVEATAPKEKRRKFVAMPSLLELAGLVGGVSGLTNIWDHVRPLLEAAFR